MRELEAGAVANPFRKRSSLSFPNLAGRRKLEMECSKRNLSTGKESRSREGGKFAEAEAECSQIINIETRVLGPDNLVTLNSRGNMAIALIGQGRFADAQYTDVLKLMERLLGVEHPDTLSYATKFAMALSHQNRIGEATEIARQLEERAAKVLGPDNPCTRRYAKLVQDLQPKK